MDFPIYLETLKFVDGQDELYQTIQLGLLEEGGAFLQDARIGSNNHIHTSLSITLQEDIRRSLGALPLDISIVSVDCTQTGEELSVAVYYYRGNDAATIYKTDPVILTGT